MEVEELERRLQSPNPPLVLDVREPWEQAVCALPGSLMVPMGQLPARLGALPRDRPFVVLCHHGVRSWHATGWLRRNGFDNAVNLRGGIDAWARRIDRGMSIY